MRLCMCLSLVKIPHWAGWNSPRSWNSPLIPQTWLTSDARGIQIPHPWLTSDVISQAWLTFDVAMPELEKVSTFMVIIHPSYLRLGWPLTFQNISRQYLCTDTSTLTDVWRSGPSLFGLLVLRIQRPRKDTKKLPPSRLRDPVDGFSDYPLVYYLNYDTTPNCCPIWFFPLFQQNTPNCCPIRFIHTHSKFFHTLLSLYLFHSYSY